ncbi:alpha/beta hydrolase [Marinobacter sp. CHS3-4]|uniref:alpha/beta fold hydrolase n=1 Tax=Marinobacter sp. CHS3-4 TaxID=3045174 RepID=UPI0024B50864|nr:alpha/beta hydrolase [Marinobacter sp. CHS3-4]MDI9243627.1 alpha/beta hydrolase [Marinobacter sp. CHS3-4]
MTQTSTPQAFHVDVGDLQFCVETRGNPEGEPVLFVMGLGAQMTLWPEALLEQYVSEGYRVIRFDNRDIGLSSHLKDRLKGHPMAVMARARMGLNVPAPYTLQDMAADVCGIMDAMQLNSCHLVGVSMGGMITQLVAANWPERVRSATLIMTSTNSPRLPIPKPSLIVRLAGIGSRGNDEDTVVARSMDFWKLIQSPDFPSRDDELRERITVNYRRSYHPAGILRQTRAILATGSLSSATRRIRQPVAVIHGKADPLVRPAAAEQLGYLMPHARVELIEGMGHDLPQPLLPRFAEIGFETMGRAR